jgi:hypothetical protein
MSTTTMTNYEFTGWRKGSRTRSPAMNEDLGFHRQLTVSSNEFTSWRKASPNEIPVMSEVPVFHPGRNLGRLTGLAEWLGALAVAPFLFLGLIRPDDTVSA